MSLTFVEHRARWNGCVRCDLSKTRKHVVLLRGTVPAKVLFVGEAPGTSEDVIGKPFIGPAGKLLDQIIAKAGLIETDYALTNLIACIPCGRTEKVSAPPEFAITACWDRFKECVNLVKPRLLVWVGGEAKQWGPKLLTREIGRYKCKTCHITHPAALLRMHITQIGLETQRQIVTLADAWSELCH